MASGLGKKRRKGTQEAAGLTSAVQEALWSDVLLAVFQCISAWGFF